MKINQIITEKSSSKKQAKTMTAACKSAKFRKKVDIPKKVACDYHEKDKGTFHESMGPDRSQTSKLFYSRVINHLKYWIDAVRHEYILHWPKLESYMHDLLTDNEYWTWKNNFNGRFPTRLKVQLDLLGNITKNYYDSIRNIPGKVPSREQKNAAYQQFKEDYTEAMIKFAEHMQKYYNAEIKPYIGGVTEDINDIEFQQQNNIVMKTKDGQDVNTNMDDPATPTLVRNKQTKKLEVKPAGENLNKAEYDAVDDTDPNKAKKVQQELEKQKKEQEREARKAQLQAQRQQTTTGTGATGA